MMDVDEFKNKLEELASYIIAQRKPYDRTSVDDIIDLNGDTLEYMISFDGDDEAIYVIPADIKKEPFDELYLAGRSLVGEKIIKRDAYDIHLVVTKDLKEGDLDSAIRLMVYQSVDEEKLKRLLDKYNRKLSKGSDEIAVVGSNVSSGVYVNFNANFATIEDADALAKEILELV